MHIYDIFSLDHISEKNWKDKILIVYLEKTIWSLKLCNSNPQESNEYSQQ